VITVKGQRDDYAILKQVQQLKLRHPGMAIAPLDAKTDFSHLALDEPLYLVSHGAVGSLINPAVSKEDLAQGLTDQKLGVPMGYVGGIILLSCYSGEKPYSGESLAEFLARSLKGRAARGMAVTGATGYSFGTPELRDSGRSSVVVHAVFNTISDNARMTEEWLKLRPTHAGGVLASRLGAAGTGKTIGDQLTAAKEKLGKAPEDIAREYVREFAEQANAIELTLKRISLGKNIPGATAADRAAYLVNDKNDKDEEVIAWNKAIAAQYSLYFDFYLWKSPADAFTIEHVQ
jgi:hypothetical protein